jgi:hypothetical protein
MQLTYFSMSSTDLTEIERLLKIVLATNVLILGKLIKSERKEMGTSTTDPNQEAIDEISRSRQALVRKLSPIA